MKHWISIGVISSVLATSAGVGYWHLAGRTTFPEGLIQTSGRLEGDVATVSGKFAGRVQKLSAREGDFVTAGQTLIQLDDAQISAKVEQAARAVARLEAEHQAMSATLESLRKQVPLNIECAEAAVENGRALFAQSITEEAHARSDLKRTTALVAKSAISMDDHENAMRDADCAASIVAARRSALAQLEKQLAQAKLGWDQIRTREAELAALVARREEAEAALAEMKSILADLTIVAPISGVITTRMVNTGEVVSAGTPLLEIVDLDQLYLKVYVPEVQIGKLRLGLPGRIHVDAFRDRSFEATIRYIASRAEFTPKEVQTVDDRVKLIYAVRLYLNANPDRRLTPGLPADAVIRWQEDAPWAEPQW